jgi:hypothetical protein
MRKRSRLVLLRLRRHLRRAFLAQHAAGAELFALNILFQEFRLAAVYGLHPLGYPGVCSNREFSRIRNRARLPAPHRLKEVARMMRWLLAMVIIWGLAGLIALAMIYR